MFSHLGYYGISMSATNFGSNIFVSSILAALIEVPSYIFCIFVLDRWGRKPLFVTMLFLTGVTAIPAGFMDDGAAKTILVLAGFSSLFSEPFLSSPHEFLNIFQENLALPPALILCICTQLNCIRLWCVVWLWACVQ